MITETQKAWTTYPSDITLTFDLTKQLGNSFSLDLRNVACLRYGGTQFGYYTDLGDKRVALVKDEGVKGVTLLKGGFVTPLCDFGTGYYKNADREEQLSKRLQVMGIPTQQVLGKVYTHNGYTSLLWRPSPFRIGTLQYAHRHCPHIIPIVWEVTKTHAGNPDMSDYQLWRLIEGGYSDLVDMWEAIGFTHGCLNSDNLCLLPCGIDYGHSYFVEEQQHDPLFDPYNYYSHSSQRQLINLALSTAKRILQETLPSSLSSKL
jgi:uncharacterized protein YdiU (UPF0061 family)